eukprot:1161956-Pelagomonas_calceolata.AAC.14
MGAGVAALQLLEGAARVSHVQAVEELPLMEARGEPGQVLQSQGVPEAQPVPAKPSLPKALAKVPLSVLRPQPHAPACAPTQHGMLPQRFCGKPAEPPSRHRGASQGIICVGKIWCNTTVVSIGTAASGDRMSMLAHTPSFSCQPCSSWLQSVFSLMQDFHASALATVVSACQDDLAQLEERTQRCHNPEAHREFKEKVDAALLFWCILLMV